METRTRVTLERELSQRALQLSSSSHCKLCALCFTVVICVTCLLFVLTPMKRVQSVSNFSSSHSETPQSSKVFESDIAEPVDYSSNTTRKANIELENSRGSSALNDEEKAFLLFSAWSMKLGQSKNVKNEYMEELKKLSIPQAPHLENCGEKEIIYKDLDSLGTNGSLPPWTLWKGMLGLELLQRSNSIRDDDGQLNIGRLEPKQSYPPWIVGSEEDNYPLTRQVQKDIWIHQHPKNCSDPNLRFLVAEWERLPGFGIGAQLAGMSGMLAIAMNENRILVTAYYNRADHSGCEAGSSRSHWSCYFFPETSQECHARAFNLMKSQDAWRNGTITVKDNYTSKVIWTGRVPRIWGEPWKLLQPTTEVNGSLLMNHRKMDRRWWRAQAIRYLMRFQSEYTCNLLNEARHKAFGLQAAKMVLDGLTRSWPEVSLDQSEADIEHFVWSSHAPWTPRPLLSMHVRMGDKACEMEVVGFHSYMRLADKLRRRFPHLNSIWLSTEMQEVIDQTRVYPRWNFYYTHVRRQSGSTTMSLYEASLGRETSTNYPIVNFLMASEADFFVGALGSTWCFLIDGMRNTGGKVMAGYLSVNKDRFW